MPASDEETPLAIQRLNNGFVFVGLVEEWTLTICLLHAMFGGTSMFTKCSPDEFGYKLATPKSSNSTTDNASLHLDGFEDVQDERLYEEARQFFRNRLQRFNVSTESCEPCLREAHV